MIQLILPYIPILLAVSIFLLIFGFLFVLRKYYHLKNRRLPFSQDQLRSPGQSLLKRIDHLNEIITIYMGYLLVGPLFIFTVLCSFIYFTKIQISEIALGLVGLLVFGLVAFSLYKLSRSMRERRIVRLGYDGAIAVGQELNQLTIDGYHVYHDFPAGRFNIDHIVVGKRGVFAIETKAESKPNSERRREGATVEYNGRVLHFPKWTDTKIIEQTRLQAKWLSKWIGSATGEPVAVRGIVALPGWYVKRTSSEGIPVVNPKQFPSLFKNIQPRELSEESIKRIVHQLEQKCRDIDSTSAIAEKG